MTDRPSWAGQVVPRPPDWRPGAPAPWEGLAPSAHRGWRLDAVRAALAEAGQDGAPPADAAQVLDGPIAVMDAEVPLVPPRPAAVLLALFEESGGEAAGGGGDQGSDRGGARLVLTRRSSALRSHTGQISLPGGRVEVGEDASTAARREALEEVGLDPALPEDIGWLHPVHTFASGSLITPVVARLPARPVLTANPEEVARVFDVALADLVAPGVFSEERWRVPGRQVPGSPDGSFPVYFFQTAGELIWGATARMLMELLRILFGLPAPCDQA